MSLQRFIHENEVFEISENNKFYFAIKDDLDDSFLPERADSYATGWDVRAAHDVVLNPFEHAKIGLGIRCFAPDGWWLELRPRSSTFVKKELVSLYGVIDQNYEGEILFACQWIPTRITGIDPFDGGTDTLTISKGDRIGQLVPVRRQEIVVERITNEEYNLLCEKRGLDRGSGGFGSTGK